MSLPYKKCTLSGRRVRYAHAYGIYAPFYCISLKNIMGGGYNTARGLVSRDIAENFRSVLYSIIQNNMKNKSNSSITYHEKCKSYVRTRAP